MLSEVYSRHAKIRRSEVGDDFEFPAAGRCLRMVVHGELVSAGGFDSYDTFDTSASNLFVKYLVNLPEGWSITRLAKDTSPEKGDSMDGGWTHLSGMTQTCSMGWREVAHFSHPLCLDLTFDIDLLDHTGFLPKWPQLFFEVVSVDGWDRARAEGYGHTPLPFEPGHYPDMR